MKLAIIGGGASGLFLAGFLKHNNINIDITIYEKNKGLGRKVLASGNGKCNFMNYKAMPYDYNNPKFLEELFKLTKKEDVLNYFQSLGLLSFFDNMGRMYPVSESSSTILDLLMCELKDTKYLLETPVLSLKKIDNKYIINDISIYDYVVIASGSNASIDPKKTTSTYGYIPSDIKINPLRPSLVGFKVKEDIKILSGYRSKCKLKFIGTNTYEETGEVIFKDDGISGICVMNSSFYYDNTKSYLILDLLPNVEASELKILINNRKSIYKDSRKILTGILHPKFIDYVIKNNITLDDVINIVKCFKLEIIDTYSMKDAQVSKGGIDINEINLNFEIKKYPHMYAIGEALDIDGLCGGYNLLFAFTSAYTLGKVIINENTNK